MYYFKIESDKLTFRVLGLSENWIHKKKPIVYHNVPINNGHRLREMTRRIHNIILLVKCTYQFVYIYIHCSPLGSIRYIPMFIHSPFCDFPLLLRCHHVSCQLSMERHLPWWQLTQWFSEPSQSLRVSWPSGPDPPVFVEFLGFWAGHGPMGRHVVDFCLPICSMEWMESLIHSGWGLQQNSAVGDLFIIHL